MMELTELERAVLAKLLSGEHPLLDELRQQLAECRVTKREMTGHGFFAHLHVESTGAGTDVKVSFGDVVGEIQGMPDGAGFELFIEQGRLHMLEGYGYDDPWPTTITSYILRFSAGEERDWEALRKALG